jgi:acetyl esterase
MAERSGLRERAIEFRRRAAGGVIKRLWGGASTLAQRAKIADPTYHGLEVERDIAYLDTGMREHRLDVYRPPGAQGLPIVFYVHGGGFHSMSKDTHWIMGLGFARRGLVTVLPSYRLAPHHRFPSSLEDVAAALRFVADNAHRWGGDPSRIIFAGESAGANLVTSTALGIAYERDEPYARLARDTGVVPKAVLAACGVFEVSNGHRFKQKFPDLGWFFDDRYRELEGLYAPIENGRTVSHDLMNPLQLVEREAPKRALPPFFLPVGALDHLKDDHERLERALRAHGADVQMKVYPGGPHAFHAFVFSKRARECWMDQFQFLNDRGIAVDMSPLPLLR